MHNELKIFGCNYRHYNLHDERWIGKDKISENLIANNYVFINNEPKSDINILGFADLMRSIIEKSQKQIVITTHDETVYQIFRRKLPPEIYSSRFIDMTAE